MASLYNAPASSRPMAGSYLPVLSLMAEARTSVNATNAPHGVMIANDRLPVVDDISSENKPSVLLSILALSQKKNGLPVKFSKELPTGTDSVLGLPFVMPHLTNAAIDAHFLPGVASEKPILADEFLLGIG